MIADGFGQPRIHEFDQQNQAMVIRSSPAR